MRAATFLITAGAIVASGVCVCLGFWQLSRLREKRALNAAIQAAEGSPQLLVTGEPPAAEQAVDRTVRAAGRFDEAHQFLLSGRLHEGEPGVEVVTPLRLGGSRTAILVNRGWLPAADAATARPLDHPEPGERTVEGVAEPLRHGAGPPGPRVLEPAPGAPASDSFALYGVRWLDADSIAARLPYPVAGFVLRQRPGPGVPDLPRRTRRPLHDETMHIGYAFQWFLFALIIPGGTAALAWSRRRRAGSRPSTEARS